MKRLGVNIDHIATIRNARGGNHPEPLIAAKLAMKYGADSITVHLREDRRHIKDVDVKKLCQNRKQHVAHHSGRVKKIYFLPDQESWNMI